MSTLTVTLTGVCSGGNHLTLGVTGDKTMTLAAHLPDLQQPPSDDDIAGAIHVLAWMAFNGRTLGQARTLLQAGVTITV